MIKTGPHMYSEQCECDSCAGWRHCAIPNTVTVEYVRREAELVIKHARVDHGLMPYEPIDPCMSIPCSVILALCDMAERAEKPSRVISFSEVGGDAIPVDMTITVHPTTKGTEPVLFNYLGGRCPLPASPCPHDGYSCTACPEPPR